jgi:2-dehydro-3-deoxyphosphogluconate aldolase / (4S)-4-hydroxy-2-oxoglutarate aldolase
MPHDFVATLGTERAVAILRCSDQRVAAGAMDAAVRGGFRIIEFTFAVPGVLELIADFSRRPDVIAGAGTVLSVEQARQAVRAGARFLVSPIVDEAVIGEAIALGAAPLPGVHTPTEMWRASRAGAEVLKLFPSPAGGPDYLRAILGPMPELRIVPTNGVTLANTRAYLDAGAFAVAYNAAVFAPELLAGSRWDEVERRARELIKEVHHGRP